MIRISLIQKGLPFVMGVGLCLGLVSCRGEEEQRPASQENQSLAFNESGSRLVCMGGDVTEIVYALGAGGDVVGVDKGSQYPPEVAELPQLNYHRQIASEGVLALEPTMVLVTEESGPKESIEQIQSAGVRVEFVEASDTIEGATRKMRAISMALGLEKEGEALVRKMEADIDAVKDLVEQVDEKDRPRVLFVYARRGMGAPMVGGAGTSADAMIALAGGVNAGSEINGFKPVTPESLLKMQPDYILMLDKGFVAVGGEEGLMSLPGMKETRAGQLRQFLSYPDDLLLSFGPRTGEAAMKLYRGLYGQDMKKAASDE